MRLSEETNMGEPSERSLKMLATALEKEEQGRNFYQQSVNSCFDDFGKEMFRILMNEEGVHITRIKEIYSALQGGKPWSADWKSHQPDNENLQELFRKRMRDLGAKETWQAGDLEAVNVGLQFEQSAIKFYEEALTDAVDPLEKEFIEAMIREERVHYASLADLKQFFSEPELWLAEMERHTLDGA
jgi:rubrerythrin